MREGTDWLKHLFKKFHLDSDKLLRVVRSVKLVLGWMESLSPDILFTKTD